MANHMDLPPEDVARLIIETVLGPTPSDIDREVEHGHELRASLQRACADINAGRLCSHDEVVEWHRNRPK